MVHVERLETMNLLGLILRGLLLQNLRDPLKSGRAKDLRGTVLIHADRMRVTLRLSRGEIWILRGEQGTPDARVEGSLGALLHVALGRGLFTPTIRGDLWAGGRILLLMRLLPLLRVDHGG